MAYKYKNDKGRIIGGTAAELHLIHTVSKCNNLEDFVANVMVKAELIKAENQKSEQKRNNIKKTG